MEKFLAWFLFQNSHSECAWPCYAAELTESTVVTQAPTRPLRIPSPNGCAYVCDIPTRFLLVPDLKIYACSVSYERGAFSNKQNNTDKNASNMIMVRMKKE
jgi:hypothetical protein